MGAASKSSVSLVLFVYLTLTISSCHRFVQGLPNSDDQLEDSEFKQGVVVDYPFLVSQQNVPANEELSNVYASPSHNLRSWAGLSDIVEDLPVSSSSSSVEAKRENIQDMNISDFGYFPEFDQLPSEEEVSMKRATKSNFYPSFGKRQSKLKRPFSPSFGKRGADPLSEAFFKGSKTYRSEMAGSPIKKAFHPSFGK